MCIINIAVWKCHSIVPVIFHSLYSFFLHGVLLQSRSLLLAVITRDVICVIMTHRNRSHFERTTHHEGFYTNGTADGRSVFLNCLQGRLMCFIIPSFCSGSGVERSNIRFGKFIPVRERLCLCGVCRGFIFRNRICFFWLLLVSPSVLFMSRHKKNGNIDMDYVVIMILCGHVFVSLRILPQHVPILCRKFQIYVKRSLRGSVLLRMDVIRSNLNPVTTLYRVGSR
jgi:hypothetical protein